MRRRTFIRLTTLAPLAGVAGCAMTQGGDADRVATASALPFRRMRPGDAGWPAAARWNQLKDAVGGRLVDVHSPLDICMSAPASTECTQVFAGLRNPYYIGDNPALTQTLGWVDAWTSAPSVYAVAASNTSDVVAAVNFARDNKLRLVVKGGGHSYQGTSNAADSLLVWTRHMNAIELHDAFVPQGCGDAARPAVTIEAGAMWVQAYAAVTTQHGRYVQGGGCMTVGVAGLVQSGGFGSFSKQFGTAAGSLLEAEIVTADGQVRIANRCNHPELFWGIKGGGGGSLGVVTRVTLATHELPALFGLVNCSVQASSDAAFLELITHMLAFYRDNLANGHWGEQIRFKAHRVLSVELLFQGLDHGAADVLWKPFFDYVASAPEKFTIVDAPRVADFPARYFWNPDMLRKFPGAVIGDDRAGASPQNVFWSGDAGQVGQVLHSYDSLWLPAALLDQGRLPEFAGAVQAAAAQWEVSLHLNKGLAGAPAAAVAAARDTAMNPAVLDAFALAIIAAEEPPAYPGIPGHEVNVAEGRFDAARIQRAMDALRAVAPVPASYVSEGNYFDKDWQRAFWGSNYARLARAKAQYDPEGLFFVHHGVGSDAWSADGFTRLG